MFNTFLTCAQVVDIPIPEPVSKPEPGPSASEPAESDSASDNGKGKGKGKAKSKSPSPAPPQGPRLTYDPEWLAISRAFHPFLSLESRQRAFPLEERARALVSEARKWIVDDLARREPGADLEDLEVGAVQEFVMTAPGPGKEEQMGGRRAQRQCLFSLVCFQGTDTSVCSAVVYEPANGQVL
jgi:hypothetical protein